MLPASHRLLFIGDSITDCHRRADPEQLGDGYVRLIRDYLAARDPASIPTVLNRGISGHKVTDLQKRWDTDVLAERPDTLSIKIGINDVWHGLRDPSQGVLPDAYHATYRHLLTQTRARLPHIRLVLCEPSVISPPAAATANEILRPYVAIVQSLAQEFAATLVPLHAAFLTAEKSRPDLEWTNDGVHPTALGHMLIARHWLKAAELL